jgi:hypothetical protein
MEIAIMFAPFGALGLATAWISYATDAAQRTALFWDVMRQRGNQWQEHMAETVPHVLEFPFDLVVSGHSLPRPVNYGLVRIPAPPETPTDPRKRPFVIVDPRAGHGPGIGGFKRDSEIGMALANAHPTYFVGFTPDPVPGQTLDDVFQAVLAFMRAVRDAHPEAEGAPAVIGNCQAGRMVMIAASLAPELFGPIMLAGSPLSYWAGQRGRNPMRYSGGLLGGSWLTALSSDLGNGIFDGAHLVSNFEGQDPANTYWKKPYGLYRKVDTEGPRFLGFERWWGGHVQMNASEMQWIVDNLFVGNRLTAGRSALADGTAIDLRRVAGPIVVLCSKGDNITPPAQALSWITDLYSDEAELIACGRTIVYAVHETVGHLGIFVSGSVAKKEHAEFAGAIALIDVLPPGLYEMVLAEKTDAANPELAAGDYIARFEPRGFDALRQHVDHAEEDEGLFATAARVSEINLGLYRTLMQPWIKLCITEPGAQALRQMNPATLAYSSLHDGRPLAGMIAAAETARAERRPVAAGCRVRPGPDPGLRRGPSPMAASRGRRRCRARPKRRSAGAAPSPGIRAGRDRPRYRSRVPPARRAAPPAVRRPAGRRAGRSACGAGRRTTPPGARTAARCAGTTHRTAGSRPPCAGSARWRGCGDRHGSPRPRAAARAIARHPAPSRHRRCAAAAGGT